MTDFPKGFSLFEAMPWEQVETFFDDLSKVWIEEELGRRGYSVPISTPEEEFKKTSAVREFTSWWSGAVEDERDYQASLFEKSGSAEMEEQQGPNPGKKKSKKWWDAAADLIGSGAGSVIEKTVGKLPIVGEPIETGFAKIEGIAPYILPGPNIVLGLPKLAAEAAGVAEGAGVPVPSPMDVAETLRLPKAIDNIFDALVWPIDRLEQSTGALGFMLADKLGVLDVPDGMSYWELGNFGLDIMLSRTFQHEGEFGPFYWHLPEFQEKVYEISADRAKGMEWNELREKHGASSWYGELYKIAFDPLNYAGIGMIGNISKLSGKAVRTAAFIDKWPRPFTAQLERVPISLAKGYSLIKDITPTPIKNAAKAFKSFTKPPEDRVLDEALDSKRAMDRITLQRADDPRRGFWLRNQIRYSLHTMAEHAHSSVYRLLALPFQAADGATPREILGMAEAIVTGNADTIAPRFGQLARDADALQLANRVIKEAGVEDFEKLKSVQEIRKLSEVNPALLDDPSQSNKLFSNILNELDRKAEFGAGKMFAVDMHNPAGFFFSAMRGSLVMMTLNRAGFMVINVLNNIGTGLWDDIKIAKDVARGGIFPSVAAKQARSRGLDPELVKRGVTATGTVTDMTGVGRVVKPTVRNTLWKTLTPFVHMTKAVDDSMRIMSYNRSFDRFVRANIKRLPAPSPELAAKFGLVEDLKAAMEDAVRTGDAETFNALRKSVREGISFATAQPTYKRWLLAQGYTDEQAETLLEQSGDITDYINEALRTSKSLEELVGHFDNLNAITVIGIHESRRMSNLDNVGRIRVGGWAGELANIENLRKERNVAIISDFNRLLKMHSVPNRREVMRVIEGMTDDLDAVFGGAYLFPNNVEILTNEANAVIELAIDQATAILRQTRPELVGLFDQAIATVEKGENDVWNLLDAFSSLIQVPTVTHAGSLDYWDEVFDILTSDLNRELRLRKALLGVRPRNLYKNKVLNASELPNLVDAESLVKIENMRFMNEEHDNITKLFTHPVHASLGDDIADATLRWLDELEPAVNDTRIAAQIAARAGSDFTMINYGMRLGAEDWLRWVFPFLTWPTRTVYHWGQRMMAHPGRMSVFARLNEMKDDLNNQFPERFKNDWQLPMPGIAQEVFASLTGSPGTAQFFSDPLRVFFSPYQMEIDYQNEDRRKGVLGSLLDFSSNLGPAPNPLATKALALTGMGIDREAWLNQQWFSGGPGITPSYNAGVGLYALFDGEMEPAEFQEVLLGRKYTPEGVLRKVLRIPDDKWDAYRIQRSAAAINAVENEELRMKLRKTGASDEEIQAALQEQSSQWWQAVLNKSGPKWKQAVKFAGGENGLRYLASWLLGIPVSAYTQGEQIQRGLDTLYDAAAKSGNIEQFYEMYPEYTTYSAALSGINDPDEAKRELSTSAFHFERGKVSMAWDGKVDELEYVLRNMQADEEFLKTEHGRFRMAAVRAELKAARASRSSELNAVSSAFPFADLRPSLRKPPQDRAKSTLVDAYYNLVEKDYSADFKHIKDEDDREEAMELRHKQDIDKLQAALPAESKSASFWLNLNVQASVIRLKYDQEISKANIAKQGEKMRDLVEERDLVLEKLTDYAAKNVSKSEFVRFIEGNGKPPSPAYAAFLQAQDEFSTYVAILDEATGVSEKERRRAADIYRDSHPLIDHFYGNEREITRRNYAAAALMNKIRSEYYELENDLNAQLDYLYEHLDMYNEAGETLGLAPLSLYNWIPDDDVRDDIHLPGTLPAEEFLDQILTGRYDGLFENG